MNTGLDTFLSNIWGPEKGTIFLAVKNHAENYFKVTKPQTWPDNSASITGFITQANVNLDPYYTPGIFIDGAKSKEKENGWRAKCLWVDVDGGKDGQSGPERARERLAELGWLPEPSYELETSPNSQHWYWLLEEYQEASVINDLNRRLAYFLGADTACWDISHVMRPPFTHNHKPKHKVDGQFPEVKILKFNAEFYDISDFEKLPQVKEAVADSILNLGEIPKVSTIMGKYPWDKEHTLLFRRTKEYFYDAEAKDYTNRGNAMARLAYFSAEIGMPDEAIYAIVEHCDNRWEKFKGRKDRDKQLISFVVRARGKYPSALIVDVQDETPAIKPIYGFREFLNSEFQFDWIYENFIPKSTINFISAKPGAGKSRFIMQLMAHLALGKDFLGYKLVDKTPRKVIMFSLEMGGPILKKFSESLAEAMEFSEAELDHLDEYLKLIPAGEALAIDSAEGRAFFDMVLNEVKPDVVFIDAMGSLDHDELSENVSKRIMGRLKRYLNSHGVTFYLVHHNKKSDQASINKPPTLNDFYGNTYGATDAASILALWKNPAKSSDLVELHELKTRIGVAPAPKILDARSKFTYSIVKDEEYESYFPPKADAPQNTGKEKPGRSKATEENGGITYGFDF